MFLNDLKLLLSVGTFKMYPIPKATYGFIFGILY